MMIKKLLDDVVIISKLQQFRNVKQSTLDTLISFCSCLNLETALLVTRFFNVILVHSPSTLVDNIRGGGSILLLVRPNGIRRWSGKRYPNADPTYRGAEESVPEIRITTSIPRVSLVGAFSTCFESSF